MSQIRPKILMRYGRINEPVRVPFYDLLVDPLTKTVLTADTASGVNTLTVKNITNFAVNQILLIGEPGQQGSEIIKTHASTAPSGSTITLASNLVFPHSSSTWVYRILYDQLEISIATTATGSKTPLSGMPVSIVANLDNTDVNDTANSSGFYFARWKNSISAAFSDYSDAAPYGGYTLQSARSIIDKALGMINKKTSEVLSDEYAFNEIDNCQTEVLREFKRWSFMQSFNSIIGTATTGMFKIAVPTDLDDTVTNKSIYHFRIGRETDMIWVDKDDFDNLLEGVAYSTLASTANINDSTLTLTNSVDFDDSGTIQVGPNQYTWTANNRTTGVLTLQGTVTAQAASGTDVFQFASLGYPSYWTIWGGNIYFWPLISSSYNNRNFYMDYYSKQVQITSDYQNIILPDPTVVIYYLAWKFLLKLNNGESNSATDAMYDKYIQRREKMKQKEALNRNFVLDPDLVDSYY